MKNNKRLCILYFILASLCFVTSILFFNEKENTGMGVMWLCIGCGDLCLGLKLLIDDRRSK